MYKKKQASQLLEIACIFKTLHLWYHFPLSLTFILEQTGAVCFYFAPACLQCISGMGLPLPPSRPIVASIMVWALRISCCWPFPAGSVPSLYLPGRTIITAMWSMMGISGIGGRFLIDENASRALWNLWKHPAHCDKNSRISPHFAFRIYPFVLSVLMINRQTINCWL